MIYPLRPLFDRSWDAYRLYNDEWLPTLGPRFLHSIHVPFFIALVSLCVLLAVTALRRRPWFELSVLALLVWLGFSAVRFLTTASFALCVLGAVLASKSRLRDFGTATALLPRLEVVASLVVALVAVAFSAKIALTGYDSLAGPRRLGTGLASSWQPDGAASFIERIDLQTNLFNEHVFGSYLAWRWDGQRKLFYHGFVDDLDFYRRNYIGVTASPQEFNRIVNEFHLGAFLLKQPDPRAIPLVYYLLAWSPEWRLVFHDERSVVFLRNIPENQAALARCASPG